MNRGVLAAVTILLFAAFLNFRGIDREKYENDEALWILQGLKYWPLFRSGQWDRREWNDFDSSWGTPNPPVAKYLLGIGLAAQNVQWKWDGGNPPPKRVLAAARLPSAIAGILGCAGMLCIGLLSLPRRAAFYAALLLATSPVWIIASRHAMTDIYGATLAISSVVPFLLALKEIEGRRRSSLALLWISVSGVLAGLAIGAKLNAASTPAALGLVLMILFVRELLLRRGERDGRAGLFFLSGVVFAGAAAGTFVLMNPYLYPDPWKRFSEMIGWWTNMTDWRAASAEELKLNAFQPQQHGVRVFFGKLMMIPKSIALSLLLPLGVAIVARRHALAGGRAFHSSLLVRLAAWQLLLMVALLLGMWPNQILHPWLVWFGCLCAVMALVLFASDRPWGGVFRFPVFAVLTWGIVCAFFVWRMTFIPWPRYYIPAIPGLSLLAGYGLAAFREDLRAAFGAWPARLVDGAVIFCAVSVAVAFPDYGAARMQKMSAAGGTPLGIFLWLVITSLAAAVAISWIRLRDERRGQNLREA